MSMAASRSPELGNGPRRILVTVHVRPGSRRTSVGGEHAGALVVAVPDPPARGAATKAVLAAVAEALDLPSSAVSLARGGRSRRKVLAVDLSGVDAAATARRLARLRAGSDEGVTAKEG